MVQWQFESSDSLVVYGGNSKLCASKSSLQRTVLWSKWLQVNSVNDVFRDIIVAVIFKSLNRNQL